MQKVWHRAFDGWWYLTLREAGGRKQLKLLKGPADKDTKAAAERLAVQELALRQTAADEAVGDHAPAWATAGHVVRAFLVHSRAEHTADTAAWYEGLLTPFVELHGKVRLTRLKKKHVTAWLKHKGYNPTSANRAVNAGRDVGLPECHSVKPQVVVGESLRGEPGAGGSCTGSSWPVASCISVRSGEVGSG
jgi:hypothetical protein